MNAGITANNIAYVTSDPLYAIVRFFHSSQVAPVGVNWGGYKNPKVDALIDEAKQTFDPAKQDELLAQAHALIVDDAVLVWVVHDTNPHALSPKVKTTAKGIGSSRPRATNTTAAGRKRNERMLITFGI